MFRKIKAIRDCVRSRVLAIRQEIDNRISVVKSEFDARLPVFFPPERRRLVTSVFWVTGRFFWEFFSMLWGAVRWFGNLLLRIATFWQVVFWNSRYRNIFAAGGLFSIIMAIGAAPEFLIIIFLLIIIPFFFACLCAIAARAVLEFIYLFFKFMPPVIWVPVVAAPLGIAVVLAAVRTARAWEKRKEMLDKSKIKINSCSVSCWS